MIDMNKYIMTWEDGQHFVADNVTEGDQINVTDGLLTVIRCIDQKELQPSGEWADLPEWISE